MLPSNSRGTIYINPKFKTTHFNPKFLRNNVPSSIHINPNFLEHQIQIEDSNISGLPLEEMLSNHIGCTLNRSDNNEGNGNNTEARIIPKSRTKLIRNTNIDASADKSNLVTAINENNGKLLKIGLRKLIRYSEIKEKPVAIINEYSKQNLIKISLKPTTSSISAKNLRDYSKRYKIDRRVIKPKKFLNGIKKKSLSQFAWCRNNIKLTSKKLSITQDSIVKKMLQKENNILSANMKLELLNINGVLYKSTKTKLQRSATCDEKRNVGSEKSVCNVRKKSNGDRVLFVRGNKFVLDKSGLKLTKIQSKNVAIEPNKNICKNGMKRIDIGGLTYIAKSNNIFVRTDRHVTRNYISITKQRSINTLQNRMVKTNIPCPIYRKLGRCVASEKGKCPKLHEKEHIAICSKFLKGECTNKNCLLSHNVNFSKMPVCKFFLQGCCSREDCPYLHRKMGRTVEICHEFLKGFCILAEKCSKRHEFLCPDYESTGKCEKVKCVYCTKRFKAIAVKEAKLDRKEKLEKVVELAKVKSDEIDKNKDGEISRYFIEKQSYSKLEYEDELYESSVPSSDASDTENNENVQIKKRPKLGVLPAYIPL